MANSDQYADPTLGNRPAGGQRPAMSPRFIAIGVMFTLVLVSAIGGAAIDRLLSRRQPMLERPPMSQNGGRGGPGGMGGPGGPGGPGSRGGGGSGGSRFLEGRLTGDLALTLAQRMAIDSAMQKQFRDFESARNGIQPRLDSILRATRTEVEAILTPAQRAALPPGPTLDGPGFGGDRGGNRGGRGGRNRGGPPGGQRDGGGAMPTKTQPYPPQ